MARKIRPSQKVSTLPKKGIIRGEEIGEEIINKAFANKYKPLSEVKLG